MINYLSTFIDTLNHPNNSGNRLSTVWKIIFWKLNQLTLKLPALVELGNNIKCICYPDSSYGGMVVYTRYPDIEVVNGIKKNLPVGGVFIDVGANIGFMSLVAATKDKTKIHAFEPSPKAYPRLVENINLNSLNARVRLNNSLVSSSNKPVLFYEDERSELSHIAQGGKDGIRLKSTTLDAYCQKNSIKKIDVLKIDVEGAELQVLKGCSKMLKGGRINHIYCELNCASKQYKSNNSETIKFLKSHGYRHDPVPKNINNTVLNLHAWKNH